MKRAICTLLLAALLGSAPGALAADGPMLTAEDLAKLQPAYEAFLDELEDLIVERACSPTTSARPGACTSWAISSKTAATA